MYIAYVPTYPSAIWSFAFCSKKYHPLEDFDAGRDNIDGLQYYNADLHVGCFGLPNFAKQLVD
jgi:spermidine synthase